MVLHEPAHSTERARGTPLALSPLDMRGPDVKRIGPIAVFLLVLASTTTGAQEPPSSSRASDAATFRTHTDLVALNVTVTNRADKHVTGLQPNQFVILENGVRQPLTFFSAESVPLDLAILIDGSASMQGKIEHARAAAAGLARSMRSGDRASVVEFRDTVRLRQRLTTDTSAVESAIGEIVARGSTALYDALYIALKELTTASRDEQQVRRRAIVLLSDGADTASLSSYDDISELARRAGVVVYAVSLKSPADVALQNLSSGGRPFQRETDYGMKVLAQETGGRAFFPEKPAELKGIYDGIAEELGHQYALGYVPTDPRRDGAWRRVAVQVLAGDARPRTRAGYYTPAPDRRAGPEPVSQQ
jgi:Ca-activated chloride channel homolog